MVDGNVWVQCMMGNVVHGWCAVWVSGNQIHNRLWLMLLTCFLALRIFHELLHSFDTVHPRRMRGLWTGIGCRRLDHHLARYPSPSVNSESSLHGDRVYTIKISTYLLLPCLHPWCPVTESQSLKRKGRRGKHRTGSPHHFALHYSPHSLHLPPPVPWPNQQYIRVRCQNAMVSWCNANCTLTCFPTCFPEIAWRYPSSFPCWLEELASGQNPYRTRKVQ